MSRFRPIPILIIGAWILMAGILVKREYFTEDVFWLPGSGRIDTSAVEWWSGLYMNGRKIGYAWSSRTSQGDTLYRVSTNQLLRLDILGVAQVISVRSESTLNSDFSLRSFSFTYRTDDAVSSLTASGVRGSGPVGTNLEIQGGVSGRRMRLVVRQGRDTTGREEIIPLQGPIYLEAGPEMLLARNGIMVGETVRVPIFDPVSMQTRSSELRVVALDTIEVEGVEKPAWRIETDVLGLTATLWVNDEGEELRGEVPMGFITLETIRESYETAVGTGWNDSTALDLVNLAAIPARTMKIEGARQVDSMSVRLSGIDFSDFEITFGRQELIEEIVEVKKEDLALLEDYDLPNTDFILRQYLRTTPFVQSEDSRIINWAYRIRREGRSARAFAENLVHWVYEYLDKVPTAGVPTALEVLDRRAGDCNEHTVLYTALARATGLPTVMNAGVVYVDGNFYYHAWPTVWIGDWVAVDPTFDQFPADATHLGFVRGGLDRQVELMKIVGRLSIDVVSYYPLPGEGER